MDGAISTSAATAFRRIRSGEHTTLVQTSLFSTGFKKLTDRTGFEQPAKSLGKSRFKNEAAQNPTRAAKHVVRWQRARQRTSKTNVLTYNPIYRVTTRGPFRIYRVTYSRLQGHL